MSKRNRRKHIKIIELLQEAVQTIPRLLEEGKVQEVLQLLAECQDSAIVLGGHIEKLYGLETQTVATLEQYCNALYEVSVAINHGGAVHVVLQELQRATECIATTYDSEFPERSEVVFLPYNASMWDSLESVWKAADADENTDAYVVPIPYYKLGENQKIEELVYEGDKYPTDVPVVHYEEYDIALRQPDAIYIHNPYDEWNAVTSVLPEFYSSRIKDYTDKLVYIPYFVLAEIKPDNELAIQHMKHFCYLPGTIYADKVIVQSEDMREIYINEYIKASAERGIVVSRESLEEKILGLGSPKYDKVSNTKKDSLEVPEEWLRIVEKPDGTWKKIIFYNTSLAAFLNNSDKMLDKIEDVLRIFYETKEDVALLWRPHPLMEQTIAAQKSELLERYQKIVSDYREAGWGIYDDTSDMDRAVILSDAYYGDMSSVVQVYQETGKPIMVQNVNSTQENRSPIAMDNLCEYKECSYFISMKDNALYKMNNSSWTIELLMRLPIHQNKTFPWYSKVYRHENKIFILPWHADDIVIYDMLIGESRIISLPCCENVFGLKFLNAVKRKEKLYLIPCSYDKILCIDMEKEVIDDSQTVDVKKLYMEYLAWGSAFEDKEKIVFASLNNNKIIQYNPQTKEILYYTSEFLERGCCGICGNEEVVWLVPRTTDMIMCWNRQSNVMKYYNSFPTGYKSGDISFYKLYMVQEKLYMLPRDANMILTVTTEGVIDKIDVSNDKLDKREEFDRYMPYSHLWEMDGNIYIVKSRNGKIYRLNNEGKTKEVFINWSEEDKLKNATIYEKDFSHNMLTYENENMFCGVYQFIYQIVCEM